MLNPSAQRLVHVGDAGAVVACDDPHAAAVGSLEKLDDDLALAANRTMLRATSETAVASSVRSVPREPGRAASSRAACRAATMSGVAA